MPVYNSILELIGNTPLIRLSRFNESVHAKAIIYAKIEMFNPAGSIKDRPALNMIEDAIAKGKIHKGSTVIEPTSGNMGIGLALVARVYGLRLILTMPDSMSIERRTLLKARGAELVLTPAKQGMKGACEKAKEIQASIPGSIIMSQFDNPANPLIHEKTTAKEIFNDLNGKVDAVVAGFGTGGTICGIAKGLKALGSKAETFAVEPAESPIVTQGTAGPHKIQGIGANFIPGNFDKKTVSEVLTVKSDDAIKYTTLLSKTESILAGISSGCSLAAAVAIAERPEFAGKNIVAILPDTGEHYLSLGIYD